MGCIGGKPEAVSGTFPALTTIGFFTSVDILIIEDDSSTLSLLMHMVGVRGHRPTGCTRAEDALEHYRLSFYPLVLLDLFLPGMDGFEFCRWLRSQPDGDRPYVLVGTASSEARDLRKILDVGADDYLVKPYGHALFDVRLAIAEQALKVRAARKLLEDELRKERERLTYLATHDSLTKLCSREHFTAAAEAAVAATAAGAPPGALCYIDLDHFKIVNDTLGHAAGDRLLVQIAYALRNAVRGQDMVARFGGDKFLVLQEDVTAGEARLTAERIRGRVGDFVFCDSGKNFSAAASIGVAEITGETHAEHVLAAADAACYSAKRRGRNRVEVYQANDSNLARLRCDSRWSTQLRHALKNNSFELWFQPVVEIEAGRVQFHEAILRLRTVEGEVVAPPVFARAAERFNMSAEIDRHIVKLALRRLAADPALHLAINLSGASLDDAGLPGFIQKAFGVAEVDPGRATFEIAETAVISHLESAGGLIRQLREGGFRFALDDFGAGFTSFTYLKNLSVDFLKIDGSFIRDLVTEPINMAFVKVMNDIARHLRVRSVAEEVANAETAEALRGVGVSLAQGPFFHAPSPEPVW